MQGVVSVNGTITAADRAVVPVFDHGFLYGEGVYETLRTYARVPFLFDAHMARLRRSAGLLALDVPVTDAQMLEAVQRTIDAEAANKDATAGSELYIRVLLTRGVGELTYNPSATPQPTVVIITKPLPAFPARTFAEGIRVALVSVRRNHQLALNPLIKSNNLLNNALAMQEALRAGADEAVMCNHDGDIVECSQSNIFIVRGGALHTPPVSAGLLPGITREFVIELAAGLGIPTHEAAFRPSDMAGADEAFITGTTREITPVRALDDQLIGGGTPGPVTKGLMAAFANAVRG
jgi:branched-chain amino acid aminotransferase